MPTKARILVPAGILTDVSARASTTFLNVKSRAAEVEELYANCGLSIPYGCDLAKLIGKAKTLSDRWLGNETAGLTMLDVFPVLHMDRIAEAILPLKEVTDKKKYLEKLCSGSLDFFKRRRSHSKNTFWEIELWSALRKRFPSVYLCDPPDIVINLEARAIGISCKKVYSEKHVQNVLSEAVSQVEDRFDVGVVAINLDDLVPPDVVLRARDKADVDRILNERNAGFLGRHERHFRNYLSSGRLVAALVSTSAVADIADWRVRFNNARQWMVWTIPGLPQEKACLLGRFREIVTT